ncbi:UDP-glycosyltransferase UGT5-like [Onthophagus taurus]|uniref:UDP-glycosyltransferase UGT5-like n=1 Tax=Onthophagus taurus TaxID=166361 RepID=UPI0039BE4256
MNTTAVMSHCMYGFADFFKIPIITVTSSSILPWLPDVIGVPDNPSYIPNFFSPYTEDMSYFQRLSNLYLFITTKVWFSFHSTVAANNYDKEFYGKKSTDLDKIDKKTTLMLVASHFSFHQLRPRPPNFIEIAGIHIKANQSLNEEFKKYLEISTNLKGVIYFSFGSYLNTETFPGHILQAFFDVFENLPYKVLWKGDIKKFPKTYNIPKNIHFIPRMPQIPILCSSKVNLFITHGGLSSTLETIYCGKPVLTIPIWLDQLSNANLLKAKGVGRSILFHEINKENFKAELEEVLENPKYSKNVKILSEIFRGRLHRWKQPFIGLNTSSDIKGLII